jgi:anaerobic selenocysteine-containing dehydrogenase
MLFHSGSLLKNSGTLLREMIKGAIFVNSAFAKENQLRNSQKVKVITKTGEILRNVYINDEVPKNTVIVRTNIYDITHTVILPVGLKWTAARVEKV